MVKLLICGGGNGAHVMAGIAASQPDVEARVFTMFADEAVRWMNGMKESDYEVKVNQPTGETQTVRAKPTLVSKDPAEVVPGCDIIAFVVPAFAHSGYLDAIRPHAKAGVVLVGLPGQAGFEFSVRGAWGDFALQCSIMSFESLPWACRITEFGKSAEVLGTKNALVGASLIGKTTPLMDPTQMLQKCLGPLPVLTTKGHLLGITLMGTNALIHPPIMYGKWRNWDGKPLDEVPLFYNGLDEFSANMMSSVSDEVIATANAIMQQRPQVDLHNVTHIYQWYLRCYAEDISDKTNLYTAVKTNKAYAGLTHPVEKTSDGKYLPNFKFRYLTEDIAYGLVVMRGIATIAGVPTPSMDEIINWAQNLLGLEFIKDGKLTGKDLDKSRSPQKFGLNCLDTILGLK